MIYRGGQVTAETDSAGTLTLGYLWGVAADDLVAVRVYGNGPGDTLRYYVAQDGLRSVRSLSRSDGTWTASLRYDTYGKLLNSAGTIPFKLRYRWIGREFDEETGFYYLRARYYDPASQRFTQEDPIGYAGGSNVYAYGDGNPTNGRDLNGLSKSYEMHFIGSGFLACWSRDCSGANGRGGWLEELEAWYAAMGAEAVLMTPHSAYVQAWESRTAGLSEEDKGRHLNAREYSRLQHALWVSGPEAYRDLRLLYGSAGLLTGILTVDIHFTRTGWKPDGSGGLEFVAGARDTDNSMIYLHPLLLTGALAALANIVIHEGLHHFGMYGGVGPYPGWGASNHPAVHIKSGWYTGCSPHYTGSPTVNGVIACQ